MRLIFIPLFLILLFIASSCSERTAQGLVDDYEEYFSNGQMGSARRCIDEALRIDTASVFLYNARGLSSLELNEYKTSIKDFDNTLRLDSENIFALTKKAYAKAMKKDYEGALADYERAINLKGFKLVGDTISDYNVQNAKFYEEPLLFDILYLRGRVYYDTYNLFAAYDDFNLCIEASLEASVDSKFDKIPECYYWRGHTLKRMGEINRACSDLHIAAESGIPEAVGDIESICNEAE